ncbi:hypothetical protein [Cytophaga aurantiaca]|uniref:hypothetical protein n=1 Tax=Cytophaga aurantiaca TaxID=29530 RepID=UPI0003787C8E|nr:hypothetical protein [Cytophaga aurantiaca]
MDTSLKLIKQQLQNILTRLVWNSTAAGNGQTMTFSGLNNIRTVVNDMKTLNIFDGIVESLSNSVIFTTANDQMTVQIQEGRDIVNNLSLLKTLSLNFFNVLLTTVPAEDINSINIKLPPVNDFDELSKVSREIHLALTQVIFNDDINGQTKIVSVENGSIWLNVFVGASAVTVIASLVWASAVIYKKILEGQMLAQQIRGLKVKNDSLEDILKAQKAETDLMIEAEAEHISSQHFRENTPENIERIKNSITTFAELIGKGAEIHPALIAPENVSNLFPDPSKLIGVESKIKRIANLGDN